MLAAAGEPHIADAEHDAYVTLDDEWICDDCFADLSRYFAWTLQANAGFNP